MKINGRSMGDQPNEVPVVLPRPEVFNEEIEDWENGDLSFICKAVTSFDQLAELLPEPQPPVAIGKGNEKVYNKKDPGYKAQMHQYNLKQLAYIVIESLRDADLEWDTVELENPQTWLNYVNDFKSAGLNMIEINKICQGCMEANALDEEKLDKARKLFQRGRVG